MHAVETSEEDESDGSMSYEGSGIMEERSTSNAG